MGGRKLLLLACVLWMHFCSVAALSEPEVCYMLDGILFFYGIVLTVLYCRMRMIRSKSASIKGNMPPSESIYTDLNPRVQDTYETVGMKKTTNM